MRAPGRFKPLAERHDQGFRHFMTSTCACGHVGRIPNKNSVPLPPQVVAKKLTALGWDIGSNPARDRCPTCAKPTPKPPHSPSKEPAAMQADPPKKPTPSERIRIIDEIETRWNRAKACYSKAWSDQSLAETIKVPRAWVTEVRVFAFADEDRNEQRELLDAEAATLKAMLAGAQTELVKAMEVVDEVERRLKAVETHMSYKVA